MEMARRLTEGIFSKLKAFYARYLRLWNVIVKRQRKLRSSQTLNVVFAIGSLFSFFVTVACAYLYLYPNSNTVVTRIPEFSEPKDPISPVKCNVFEGKWVFDESYPLYNASACPFVEHGFNCLANGRGDTVYTKWRWKPTSCEFPRFNARIALEKLRGKRVIFVGDSLSRTQWESMICMLMTGVDDKKSVYEVNGNKITRQIRFLGVRFSKYDLRVDFYRSVFLVRPSSAPRRSPKRVKSTLRLDLIDDIDDEWVDSDVLVFNSGHWWTPTKLFELGCYFQVGKSLKLGMSVDSAFRKALDTWASWVETSVNTNKTRVFFRTFESTHWGRNTRSTCNVTERPWSDTRGLERSSFSDSVIKTVQRMKVQLSLLEVTLMGAFRSDGHVGIWSGNPSVPDCSHWCLPGVPDTWNEILLSSLISNY